MIEVRIEIRREGRFSEHASSCETQRTFSDGVSLEQIVADVLAPTLKVIRESS